MFRSSEQITNDVDFLFDPSADRRQGLNLREKVSPKPVGQLAIRELQRIGCAKVVVGLGNLSSTLSSMLPTSILTY